MMSELTIDAFLRDGGKFKQGEKKVLHNWDALC